MAAPYAPPPVRRRRRWPLVLLVIVLVLAVLAVAADRIALHLAEDRAATALQSSQGLSHKPDVTVEGFPFLTQLARGSFGEVVVSANDVTVGRARNVHMKQVVVDLHDVTVPGDYSSVHAATATAHGSLGYDELSRLLGTQVRAGSGGRLIAQPSVNVLGQTFTGTVSAVVHASTEHGLTFDAPRVSVDGVNVPSEVARLLAQVFARSISLAGLPFHVQVTGVDVNPDALVVNLAGRDLTYRR
jgi:hypothetical protein